MNARSSLHPGWIAGGIAVLVALWLLSGAFGGDAAQAEMDAKKAAPSVSKLTKVRVRASSEQMLTRQAAVSARTAAARSVVVRAEISGRVDEIVAERGSLLEQGAVILKLAPRDLAAQLDRARAQLRQRELEVEAARKISKQGLISPVQLASAESDLRVAQAELKRLSDARSHTVVRAPFAGVLETRPLELGDFVSIGDEVGRVVQQDPMIIVGSVSEDVIAYLEIGQEGTVQLPDQTERKGRLRYANSVANENTRTFIVELEVPNPSGRLIAGTSAILMLPLEQVQAHVVEPSSLALDEQGDFGVKSVNAEGKVEFYEAHIAQNRNGQVWLSGLPAQLRIITVGQGFVSAGDAVDAVDVTDKKR